MPKPLLFVSDSISCSSGLGRITRDLATRVHEHLPHLYRVATAGYGGSGSKTYAFPEYHFHSVQDWLLPELPQICTDFAGDEELTIFFIWDVSRLYWIANPQLCPLVHLRRWLEVVKQRKWIYHAIDASGPNNRLSHKLAESLKHFDRVLDYSEFSCRVTGNTQFLPHGIDTTVFRPYERIESKRKFREAGFPTLTDDSILVGMVGTNQARKDWALGIQTCRELIDRGHDIKIWCHIDQMERYWSLPNLIADYGLAGRVAVTMSNFTDEQMARFYSACDVFLSIGLGEGFGYGTYEAMACGVPVVAPDYCGSAYVPPSMKVTPIAWRHEGPYAMKRPVFHVSDWVDCAESNIGLSARLPMHLDWNGPRLWREWQKWFEEGAE